jgi:hypothetical protein
MRKTALKVVLAVIAVVYLSVPWPAKASEPDDRQAMDILQKMSKTLAEAEQFSVTLYSSYDAPQANGQMVEFGARRDIQVKRPDKLRVDKQRSDGDQRIMVFDGKQIIIHNLTENVYAMATMEGTIDDAVKYLVGILKTPLPLARLFLSNVPDDMEQIVQEIDYVELNMLTDVPTDHLAVRTRDVDFQIWITREEKPLPRRVVITYKNFEGAPQFRAYFSNWDLSAKGVKGPFTYSVPKNAEQVPMLVRKRTEAYIPTGQGGAK